MLHAYPYANEDNITCFEMKAQFWSVNNETLFL